MGWGESQAANYALAPVRSDDTRTMSTPVRLLTPAELAASPDLDRCRPPSCPRCGAVAATGLVGLHGDGVRRRWVAHPGVGPVPTFVEVLACFRRFWCPRCRHGCLVGHPGIVPRIRASVAAVAAAVRAAAVPPLGEGLPETEIRRRLQDHPVTVPISERARSGEPRWIALRRWVARRERWWPTLVLVGEGFRARALAFTAAIGPGLSVVAFVEAAVQAHRRGAAAM